MTVLRDICGTFVTCCCLFGAHVALAEGPFDPTFSDGGLYLYRPAEYAAPQGLAQDSSGRLLVATTTGTQLSVTRHTANGDLDNTFGTAGVASDFVYVDSSSKAWASSITVDHKGRAIVGGGFRGPESCAGGGTEVVETFLIVRLSNVPGSESESDSSFGTLGIGTYGNCAVDADGIVSLSVGSDDSIFGVGTSDSNSYQAIVVKWDADGQIASDFGTAGVVAYKNSEMDETYGVAVANDSRGGALMLTQSFKNVSQSGAVVRFTSQGKLDPTFGHAGVFDLGILSPNIWSHIGYLCCIRIDDQDRTLVSGLVVDIGAGDKTTTRAFVARLTDAGIPDETFGVHGFASIGESFESITALELDQKGRAYVAGTSTSAYEAVPAPTLVQLNLNGTINKAAGFGGVFSAEFGFDSSVDSLLVSGDGRITIGTADYDSSSALVRYARFSAMD